MSRVPRLVVVGLALRTPPGWRIARRQALRKVTRASGIAFLKHRQTDLLAGKYSVGVGGASVDGRRLSNGRVVINGPMLATYEEGFDEGPSTASRAPADRC